ncbi:MAG: fused response regulator/phosphatase [Saccharospirillaceae bacterium]|nr:fused response regulator/phosphatase [Pseudomonadales bacterium]NRB80843.1 fused response regulator/phosphatase [Saccharospirillaceae bacterium]
MTEQKSLKILIADDNDSDRMLLSAIVKKEGHEVIEAINGAEAVSQYVKHSPSLILLDALMPIKDGFEAAQEIKQIAGNQFIPIIFLTSLQDAKSLARCLDSGGDDFLSKPYNRSILKAKINAFYRMRMMNQMIQEHAQQMVVEQKVAKKIFDNVAHLGCLDSDNIQYSLSPLSVFNGDIVLAERKPDGGMYIFIGDFTGHGLPAAIGAMPLAEIFYGMTKKGFSIHEILTEINTKLTRILPVQFFCCAAMVDLDFVEKTARIFVGGLPALYLWREKSKTFDKIDSSSVPLGVMSRENFKPDIQDIPMYDNDRIFLWSDGIIESRAKDGEMFGEERLENLFNQGKHQDELFNFILDNVDQFMLGGERDDDITLVSAQMVDIESLSDDVVVEKNKELGGPLEWSLHYELQSQSLRVFNPLPLVLQIVTEVDGLKNFSGQLYTLLAELYSNALEHGVLGLDSNLKTSGEGFAKYYSLRKERLDSLTTGFIRVILSHEPLNDGKGGRLRISFEDSGPGFNFQKMLKNEHKIDGYCGRGLPLIRTICEEFYYEGVGNKVNAVVVWPNIVENPKKMAGNYE